MGRSLKRGLLRGDPLTGRETANLPDKTVVWLEGPDAMGRALRLRRTGDPNLVDLTDGSHQTVETFFIRENDDLAVDNNYRGSFQLFRAVEV